MAETLKTRVMESEKNELTANMASFNCDTGRIYRCAKQGKQVNVQLPLITPAGVSPSSLKPIFKLMIDKLIDEYNAIAAM